MSFAEDAKPPGTAKPGEKKETEEADAKVEGVIGQLEVYESGAVKMRLANGIVMDVSSFSPPLSITVRSCSVHTGDGINTTLVPPTRRLPRSRHQANVRARRGRPPVCRLAGYAGVA